MQWDQVDDDDTADLQVWRYADKVMELSKLNSGQEIVRRRQVRQILRGLVSLGTDKKMLSFLHTAVVIKTYTRTTGTGQNRRTETKSERVTMYVFCLRPSAAQC